MYYKKSQIWYFDFIMGVTIFTLILIVAFRFVTSDLYIPGKETNFVLAEAKRLSETLLTSGSPINWSEDTVLIPGIIDEGNVLNITKLEELMNMTNKSSNKVKQLFGIKSDFLIYFEDKDNNVLWSFDNLFMGGGTLTSGLLGYWDLEDTSAIDRHGTHDGTNNGAVNIAGKLGGGLGFDDGDRVTLPPGAWGCPSDDFTISTWIYIDVLPDNTANGEIMYSGTGATPSQIITDLIVAYSPESNVWKHGRYNNNWAFFSSSDTPNINTWYYVVSTYENGVYTLYRDNNMIASDSTSAGLSCTDSKWQIGGGQTDGIIDEVGLWDRAITPAEISDLYNSGNGLAYPFTSGSGASVNDVKSLNPKKIITLTRYIVYKHNGISEIIAMKVVLWQE